VTAAGIEEGGSKVATSDCDQSMVDPQEGTTLEPMKASIKLTNSTIAQHALFTLG
jgi:hypothetical protein